MGCHKITTPDKKKQNAELAAQEDQLKDRYILICMANKDATSAFKVMKFHYKRLTNMEHSSLRSFKVLSIK